MIRNLIPKTAKNAFRKRKKTFFITHGFWNNAKEDWVERMKIAFLEKVMFLILHFAYNIETMIIN
jgi:Lipase